MKNEIFALLLLLLTIPSSCMEDSDFWKELEGQEINYTVIAHSHNDYERKNPLYAALGYGFTSIEVDIVYDGKEIKVSHDSKNLAGKPEFESLLVKLNAILENYKQYLVSRKSIEEQSNKIKVLLSGAIPREEILTEESNEFLFLDGRISDLDKNFSSALMPIISMDFTDLTSWKGIFEPSKNTIEKIRNTIQSVHEQGKLIRFWKTKDRALIWLTLIDLEVDILGVDDLEGFFKTMEL